MANRSLHGGSMKRFPVIGVLLALYACEFNPRAEKLVEAARQFTELHAKEDFHGFAAGDDCRVLLVRAEARLGDAAVESIYYGTGDSGGVQQFLEDHGFRAVVYTDPDRGRWTYGSITTEEAQSLRPCR
jgi:hypothetical protein